MHQDLGVNYQIQITIYIVENGYVIKDGSPQSLISKTWVARTKEELAETVKEVIAKIQLLKDKNS
jgi:hypothetical protein